MITQEAKYSAWLLYTTKFSAGDMIAQEAKYSAWLLYTTKT